MPNEADPVTDGGRDVDGTGVDPLKDQGAGGREVDGAQETELTQEGEEKLQSFMTKHGIKDATGLAEYIDSQETKITKLGQEKRVASLIPPAPAYVPPQTQPEIEPEVEIPDDPMEFLEDKTKFKNFLQSYGKRVAFDTRKVITAEVEKANYTRMYNEAVEKINADPDRFLRLKPRMVNLSNSNPNANLDWLMAKAEEEEKAEISRMKGSVLDSMGIDEGQLKTLIPKMRVPRIASGGGPGAPADITSTEQARAEKSITDKILSAKFLSD